MDKIELNAWFSVDEEQAKELQQHINGEINSELFCEIAEELDAIDKYLEEKYNINFYWYVKDSNE